MKNPLIPYGLIAVLGILAVIAFSFVGANQRTAILNPDEANTGEELTIDDADEIYQNKCATCHGSDLSGSDSVPDLTQIGNELDQEEIMDIIINGMGQMPPGMADPDEAEILGEWLEEHK